MCIDLKQLKKAALLMLLGTVLFQYIIQMPRYPLKFTTSMRVEETNLYMNNVYYYVLGMV